MNSKLVLKTKRGNVEVIVGYVTYVNREKKFGFISVADHESGQRGVHFSLGNVYKIVAGRELPETAGELGDFRFEQGTQVVLIQPELSRRPEGGFLTFLVGVGFHYSDAVKEIAGRPYYFATHVNCTSNGAAQADQPYFEGTLADFNAEYPRLAKGDPLAPFHTTGAGAIVLTAETKWERRNADGSRSLCADPRSFPPGVTNDVYRVWQFEGPTSETGKGRKRVQAFYGHLGELLERSTSFVGEDFAFEKRIGSGKDAIYVEVADPRVKREFPKASRKQIAALPPTAPVAGEMLWVPGKPEGTFVPAGHAEGPVLITVTATPDAPAETTATASPVTDTVQPARKQAEKPAGNKSVAPPKRNTRRPGTTAVALDKLTLEVVAEGCTPAAETVGVKQP